MSEQKRQFTPEQKAPMPFSAPGESLTLDPKTPRDNLQWALCALELVANGLRNRRQLQADDVEMQNLNSAKESVEIALRLIREAALSETVPTSRERMEQVHQAFDAWLKKVDPLNLFVTCHGFAREAWQDATLNAAPLDAPDRKVGDGTEEVAVTRRGVETHPPSDGRKARPTEASTPSGCDPRENPGTTPAAAAFSPDKEGKVDPNAEEWWQDSSLDDAALADALGAHSWFHHGEPNPTALLMREAATRIRKLSALSAKGEVPDLIVIEEAFPLQGDFAQDAKYTWPSRWQAIKDDLSSYVGEKK